MCVRVRVRMCVGGVGSDHVEGKWGIFGHHTVQVERMHWHLPAELPLKKQALPQSCVFSKSVNSPLP